MNRLIAFRKHSLHIMHVPAPKEMAYSAELEDFTSNKRVPNKSQNPNGEISREYIHHTLKATVYSHWPT